MLNGTSSALRMKPGLSWVLTGCWPQASVHAHAASKVSRDVFTPGDISISFISCAGRQKCMPTTRSWRAQPAAISVTDRVEVLDAKIACGAHTPSSAAIRSRFTARSSNTASITRSHPASASSPVAGVRRAIAAALSSALSLPRSTDLPKKPSVCARARSSASAQVSKHTVS